MLLDESADIETVKAMLNADAKAFINSKADDMGIVLSDEYVIENEQYVDEDGSINLYDCDEREATTPVWSSSEYHWPPFGCTEENQFGKGLVWGLFDHDSTGNIQVQRLDEPADGYEMITDDQAEDLAKMAGFVFDELGFTTNNQ